MRSLWALAVVAVLAGGFIVSFLGAPPGRPPPERAKRIVSLAPAITETLVAMGAADRIVAIDDHCVFPPEVTGLPRMGTAFSPNYEDIVALEPDAILLPRLDGVSTRDLEQLAPTQMLPWTSLEEVTASTRAIGALVGLEENADALAQTIEASLAPSTRPDPPRVLLAFSPTTEGLSEVWFMKENSLHGKALRSAGALNVMDQPVGGPPVLSLERVLELDPDMVIVLVRDHGDAKSVLKEWKALARLRAVRQKEIHVVEDRGLYVPGPRIVKLSASLKALVDRYASPPREPDAASL